MSEQDYDFTLVGSFDHQEVYEDMSRTLVQRLIWECRFCFALTNSPDSHYALSHSDFDQDGHPPLGWVRPSELKIEGR